MPNFFKPAKLSHRAVDAFMLKYVDEKAHSSSILYMTTKGQKVFINPISALDGVAEYLYLVGQISAVHKGIYDFPLNQMAVIQKKDGKQALWTHDSDLVKSLIHVGNALGMIQLSRQDSGIILHLNSSFKWKPIIHDEVESHKETD